VQLRLGQVATGLDSLLNHAATVSSSYLIDELGYLPFEKRLAHLLL
jgi:hypothetical protein